MCRSDHYSGQSSNTKESCSSTPLNRCTSTETRWNKKAVSRSSPEWWLIFLARSEKKSEADSLIGPRVSTAIGWKIIIINIIINNNNYYYYYYYYYYTASNKRAVISLCPNSDKLTVDVVQLPNAVACNVYTTCIK